MTIPAPDRIVRSRGWASFWGLVWTLSLKNFQVRYKRASLGIAWAVLQPSFQAGFLAFVFMEILQIDRVPQYALFVLAGMLPWAFFAQGVSVATTAVIDNGALVKKVALRKLVFPLSAVGGVGLAFSASLVVLLIGAVAGGHLGLNLALLPVAVMLHLLVVVSLGVLTCAFQVAFRDIKYLVESLMIVGFYSTPIVYSLDRVPEEYRPALWCNPMTGVLELYRGGVLDRAVDWRPVAIGAVLALTVLTLALRSFRRRADEFADLV